MLEWRLGHSGIIRYSGDLSNPPDNRKSGSTPSAAPGQRKNTKTIRGKDDDFSDSDFDDY